MIPVIPVIPESPRARAVPSNSQQQPPSNYYQRLLLMHTSKRPLRVTARLGKVPASQDRRLAPSQPVQASSSRRLGPVANTSPWKNLTIGLLSCFDLGTMLFSFSVSFSLCWLVVTMVARQHRLPQMREGNGCSEDRMDSRLVFDHSPCTRSSSDCRPTCCLSSSAPNCQKDLHASQNRLSSPLPAEVVKVHQLVKASSSLEHATPDVRSSLCLQSSSYSGTKCQAAADAVGLEILLERCRVRHVLDYYVLKHSSTTSV